MTQHLAVPVAGEAASTPDSLPATSQRGLLRRLVRRPAALTALALLGVLALASVLAPWVLPSGTSIDVGAQLSPPSRAHLLGTDDLGRDLLGRLGAAGRLTLGISAAATALSLALGVMWGMAAASLRGWVDEVLMRIVDAMMAIPTILFALVCVAAFGANATSLIVIVGLLMSPLTARVMRAAVLGELQTDYVRGLTVVGVSRRRILAREVLPNALPSILAQATLNVATAIMTEASLSFVGLGVQPPSASWGTLLQQGYDLLLQAAWYPIAPAITILIAITAFNVLGEQLQRVLYQGSGS